MMLCAHRLNFCIAPAAAKGKQGHDKAHGVVNTHEDGGPMEGLQPQVRLSILTRFLQQPGRFVCVCMAMGRRCKHATRRVPDVHPPLLQSRQHSCCKSGLRFCCAELGVGIRQRLLP